uniref:Uncharacterized protein n=1 Tax=Hucho hucho TaxID=62062 RepID=A0A4W5L0I0_9TELE
MADGCPALISLVCDCFLLRPNLIWETEPSGGCQRSAGGAQGWWGDGPTSGTEVTLCMIIISIVNRLPGRQSSPTQHYIPLPGRQSSPTQHYIPLPGRQSSPTQHYIPLPGRQSSPTQHYIPPPGRQSSPTQHYIPPPGR